MNHAARRKLAALIALAAVSTGCSHRLAASAAIQLATTAESDRPDRLPAVTMMNIEEASHGADLSWAHHRLRPTAHHRDDLVVPVVPGAGRHSSTRTIPGSARSVPSKNRATCSRVR
jgi:hypothetical protein